MRLLALAVALPLAVSATQAQQSPSAPPIQQLMSADELRAAGLGKLSAAEMSALNGWLQRYTQAVFLVATGQAGSSPGTQAVVESRIDGDFNGWDGETIFKLVNGQIWQQSSYAYKYVYKYGPKVLIYKSGAGYKMQVEGVDGTISVTRLN